MATIVYFITSHTNPDQIVRLVNILSEASRDCAIVIRHDYLRTNLDVKKFSQYDNVYILRDTLSLRWGGYSLVATTLMGLDWIDKNLNFKWICLLSGQDYPIRPLRDFERFLDETDYDGFLSGVSLDSCLPCGPNECLIEDNPGKVCEDCSNRYYYQYYSIPRLPYMRIWLDSFINIAKKKFSVRKLVVPPKVYIGVKWLKSPFSKDLQCYKGSQWFTINKRCVQFILEFINKNKSYVKYYKHTLIPDESFFHTMLFNNKQLNIMNDNKRYISWSSPSSPHPNVLAMKDFQNIIDSKQFFARKFDITIDSRILDVIDRDLLI